MTCLHNLAYECECRTKANCEHSQLETKLDLICSNDYWKRKGIKPKHLKEHSRVDEYEAENVPKYIL